MGKVKLKEIGKGIPTETPKAKLMAKSMEIWKATLKAT
jgi:hypothetical protein